MKTSRRSFLSGTAATAGSIFLSGPGKCRAAAVPSPSSEQWSFSLIGDLHYDQLDHHDFDWVKKEKPDSVRQIESYSRITEDNLPTLMARVKDTVKSNDCSMIVQIGDLVQGLCGTPSLAKKHCEDAVAFFKAQDFGVPFLVTKGNHDVTGPGSVEAYDETVVPFIGERMEEAAPGKAHFSQKRDRTLFVFFDAYNRESFAWFADLMKTRDPDEQVIFVVHPPVVPYNARSTWTVFGGSEAGQAKRQQLLELLGKHKAIVLCGHLHKYSLVERKTSEGAFTQLAISSVAYSQQDKPRDILHGIDQYGPDLVELEPGHSPDTVMQRREVLAAEKPHIRRFDHGNFWGHAVVKLSPEGIEADIYQMLGDAPWKSVNLIPG